MGFSLKKKSQDLVQSFNFIVSIKWSGGDLSLDLPFDKISGLREATGQIEWRASGDSDRSIGKLPGLGKADNVTLSKVYSMDTEDIKKVLKWKRAAQQREGLITPYADVTVTPTGNLYDAAVGKGLKLKGCFVVATSLSDFDLNSTDFNEFSIELSVDKIEFEGEGQ